MNRCAACKGKGLCGLRTCPITERFMEQGRQSGVTGYRGTSPSVFVGSAGYPAVFSGPLFTPDHGSPPLWLENHLTIGDIVSIRASTIRGMNRSPSPHPLLEEIALSSRPLEVEATFSRPVLHKLSFDGIITPTGLSGEVRRLDLLDNPSVEPLVERITGDTDAGARDACRELLQGGIDVYRTTDLLSAGLLGRRRRLVPTRWAITAVDDMAGSVLKGVIRNYPSVDETLVFSSLLFGNHIGVLLMPGDWKFEMVERWSTGSLWAGEDESVTTDREGMKKQGYSPITGAYYAARLAVLEYLERVRRTARVILVRSVTGEYWAPLGTWVVREAVRDAMDGPQIWEGDLEGAVSTLSRVIAYEGWVRQSHLLGEARTQTFLSSFL